MSDYYSLQSSSNQAFHLKWPLYLEGTELNVHMSLE